MALSQVQTLLGRDPATAQQLLHEARTELNRIILELRGHVEQADPGVADNSFAESTARLIHLLCGSGPITTELNIDEELVATHAPLLRNQALQFVREAISNAVRHGRPSHLSVSWQRHATGSQLVIADDGVGFDPEAMKPGGRGLGNLTERALALGGRLEVVSQPNQGTRISLNLPQAKISP
jgi:signal transduction histidine kinase